MPYRERPLTFVRPRSVSSHLHVLLKERSRIEPQSDTGMAPVFHNLAERLSRRIDVPGNRCR